MTGEDGALRGGLVKALFATEKEAERESEGWGWKHYISAADCESRVGAFRSTSSLLFFSALFCSTCFVLLPFLSFAGKIASLYRYVSQKEDLQLLLPDSCYQRNRQRLTLDTQGIWWWWFAGASKTDIPRGRSKRRRVDMKCYGMRAEGGSGSAL